MARIIDGRPLVSFANFNSVGTGAVTKSQLYPTACGLPLWRQPLRCRPAAREAPLRCRPAAREARLACPFVAPRLAVIRPSSVSSDLRGLLTPRGIRTHGLCVCRRGIAVVAVRGRPMIEVVTRLCRVEWRAWLPTVMGGSGPRRVYPARAHARARKATSCTSPLVTPPHAATHAARCESCHMKAVTLMVSNRLTTTWKGHNPCHT